MPVSPQDFNLWARVTGKKYPSTPEEKAAVAPEVHNFTRNFGKQGALGEQQEEKQPSLAQNLAKGALIAGGVAAGIAAARDPRVQQAVQTGFANAKEATSNATARVKEFLQTVGGPRTVDADTVGASYDVTPNTTAQNYQQQVVPHQISGVEPKGLLTGRDYTQSESLATRQTSGPVSAGEFARQKARSAFSEALQVPGEMGMSPTQAMEERRVQNALERMNAMAKRMGDPFSHSESLPSNIYPVPTPEGEYVPTSTVIGKVGSLMSKMEQGPEFAGLVKYHLPEAVENDVTNTALASSNTPDNLVPKAQTFNPNSLTGQHNIAMEVDNQLDRADQLINEYRQDIVDREINREAKVKSEIAAMKEGAAMRIVDELRGEAKQEQLAANENRDLAGEASALVETITTGQPTRQRPRRLSEISPQEQKAYELVAAGGEAGVPISLERAMDIAGGAQDLSFQEQRLFSPGERVAVGEQTFAPGQRQSGRMMGVRTGASGSERALGLAEQYAQADVAGLTSQGRKSAGAQRLRGMEDTPDVSAVLVGATGRPLRGMGTISLESLREASGVVAAEQAANREMTAGAIESLLGRSGSDIEYKPFTEVTTGSTPETQERARQTMAAAQKPSTTKQMNQLFATHSLSPATGTLTSLDPKTLAATSSAENVPQPKSIRGTASWEETSPGGEIRATTPEFLNIKTESGVKAMITKALRRNYGHIADNILVRAAQHYAEQDGIELPDPMINESGRIGNYDFKTAANQVLYGAGEASIERSKMIGKAFNQSLKGAGLDLETEDPYASHKLFAITQNQERGQIALQEYTRKIGRMQSQGLLKEGRQVPRDIAMRKPQQG